MQPSCRDIVVPLQRKNGTVGIKIHKSMKIHTIVFATLAYTVFALTGCSEHGHTHSDHDHEHCEHTDHDHDHSDADHHEHQPGEIVFSPEKAAAVGLQTEEVQVAPFEEALKVSGRITTPANKTQSVVAAMSGVIEMQRALNEGTVVRRGEILAHISLASMAAADPVETARIQYETAKKEYERAQSLTNSQIVSAQEMEQITLRYRTAKTQYEALQGKKAADGCIEIRAGQDGYVSGLYFANGDFVEAGQALLSISQTQQLLLEVSVPERYWGRLSSVRSANFIPAYSETTYRLSDMNGRLLSVGKTAGEQSGYVPVVFSFENRAGLVSGAYADVYLLLSDHQDAISIPLSALTEEQGLLYVYVQQDEDCYKKREVTTGESNGERVLIKRGLKPGERVVTKAALQVKLAGSATVIPGHTHNH